MANNGSIDLLVFDSIKDRRTLCRTSTQPTIMVQAESSASKFWGTGKKKLEAPLVVALSKDRCPPEDCLLRRGGAYWIHFRG